MTKPTGNPLGRPKSKGKSKKVGRPLEERGIMAEYRSRMLNSPKSSKVLECIFAAALNDDHKAQSAAWKLIMDRIVPVSGFDKLAGQSSRASITVNITGVAGVGLETDEDIIEGEYVPVEVTDVPVGTE